jgi:hypothetical protein
VRIKLLLLIIILLILLLSFYLISHQPITPSSTPSNLSPTVTGTHLEISPTPPKSYLIKTTFVPQAPEKNWDLPWQDACEEAALLTVDYYYRHQSPSTSQIVEAINQMVKYEEAIGFGIDINLSQMATISSDYLHYRPQIIDNPSLNDIKSFILSNTPVIIPANGKLLFRENRHFSHGGPWYHNLVILGFDDKKRKFITHDVGTQHGAYFSYSYDLLIEAIHDFPDTGRKEDILQGGKKALVLLK